MSEAVVSSDEPRWPRIVLPLLFIILVALCALTAYERGGDFGGYLETGARVLAGADAYANPKLNTWPPFFSLLCAPLAFGARYSLIGTRFIWLLGTVALWWYSIRVCARLVYGADVQLRSVAVVLPVLFTTRLMIENIDLIQINVYILALCLAAVVAWRNERDGLAGGVLGLAVSIKVFPVFLWAFFVARRQWRLAGFTLVTVGLCALIPFVVFGVDTTTAYYSIWAQQAFGAPVETSHLNQSLLATVVRYFSQADAGNVDRLLGADYFINIVELGRSTAELLYYAIVAIGAGVVLYLFRGRLTRGQTLADLLELGLVFGLCSLISPLVWKHYGVFWLPALMFVYPFLYRSPLTPDGGLVASRRLRNRLRIAYHLSWVLMTFSSELFLGRYYSDVAEAYGAMTIGGVILSGLLVYLRVWYRGKNLPLLTETVEQRLAG